MSEYRDDLVDASVTDYQNYSHHASQAGCVGAVGAGAAVVFVGSLLYGMPGSTVLTAGAVSAAALVQFGYNFIRARQERRDWEEISEEIKKYDLEHPSELEEKVNEE